MKQNKISRNHGNDENYIENGKKGVHEVQLYHIQRRK